MSEKKILIITYYWPPSGGSGVQRWLKFVKYLPQFGYTPYVFTPENPSFDLKDASLEKDIPMEAEVIRFPIWEPYSIFLKGANLFGAGKTATPVQLIAGKKKTLIQKLTTWARGNLIIPDPRVFWVKPSVSFLKDFIEDNEIDTIVTTGPPHSLHLIGLRLKKRIPSLTWLADFRDPWSEWGFLDSLMVGKLAKARHTSLEKQVLMHADIITTITPFYVRRFSELSGKQAELLTNGFDEDDFKGLSQIKTERFVIRHVGIVNEKCNPRPFMAAVKKLIQQQPELSSIIVVDFIGDVHADFKHFVLDDEVLKAITTFSKPVPHKALIKLYNESSLLLLVLEGYKDAEGYMPGKLFEYIATGLPILGVGPAHGDAAVLLNNGTQGVMIDGINEEKIISALSTCINRWQMQAQPQLEGGVVEGFSRRSITAKLVELLESKMKSL